MIIQCDSREQQNKEVIDYFERINQKYVISKLYAGDYCNLNKPTILIDLKKDIEELIGNLTKEHERFRNEIKRANEEMGCKLIVLIRQQFNSLEDIKSYQVRKYSKYNKNVDLRGKPMSNMNMETLYKIMNTMQNKYNLEWQFCSREESGKKIIEILEKE